MNSHFVCLGVGEYTILFNESQPTTIAAYTLSSKKYIKDLTNQITQAGVILSEVSPFGRSIYIIYTCSFNLN